MANAVIKPMMMPTGIRMPSKIFLVLELEPPFLGFSVVSETCEGLSEEVVAAAGLPDVDVLLGITKFLIVGRGAPPLIVHPSDVEVGQASVVCVGLYCARDTPVGVSVSQLLGSVSLESIIAQDRWKIPL